MGPFDDEHLEQLNSQIEQTLIRESEVKGQEILKFFTFTHLENENLRDVSSSFAALALEMVVSLNPSAERTVALRKLLESKDAAVRAAL